MTKSNLANPTASAENGQNNVTGAAADIRNLLKRRTRIKVKNRLRILAERIKLLVSFFVLI
jgi:hypothetical protein